MCTGEKQQVVPEPPGPVVAFAPVHGEALGTRRRLAPEQVQQHRVPGMEGGLRPCPGRRIGALHAEPHLDPEIGRAPAAAKAERQGLGQALQLHHGVAVQEARAGSQIEKVARLAAASAVLALQPALTQNCLRQEPAVHQNFLDGPGRAGGPGEGDRRHVPLAHVDDGDGVLAGGADAHPAHTSLRRRVRRHRRSSLRLPQQAPQRLDLLRRERHRRPARAGCGAIARRVSGPDLRPCLRDGIVGPQASGQGGQHEQGRQQAEGPAHPHSAGLRLSAISCSMPMPAGRSDSGTRITSTRASRSWLTLRAPAEKVTRSGNSMAQPSRPSK